MINEERAERLYNKMYELMGSDFSTKELEALTAVMTSEVVLKAFGRAFSTIQILQAEMAALDMKDSGNLIEFVRGQGQIEGIRVLTLGMLALITQKEEEESDDKP